MEASNTINCVLSHDNNGKVFVVADKNEGKTIVASNGKVLDTQNAIFGQLHDNVANSTCVVDRNSESNWQLKRVINAYWDDINPLTDTVTGNNVTKSAMQSLVE